MVLTQQCKWCECVCEHVCACSCVCVCAHSTSWLRFACFSSRWCADLWSEHKVFGSLMMDIMTHWLQLIWFPSADLFKWTQRCKFDLFVGLNGYIRFPIIKGRKKKKKHIRSPEVILFHYGCYGAVNYFFRMVIYYHSSAKLIYMGTGQHFLSAQSAAVLSVCDYLVLFFVCERSSMLALLAC